jgi:hypothetical protein
MSISYCFWLGSSSKGCRQCDIPSFGCRWPRMRFWSLDFVASEWNGPQALTRRHPVPACIDACDPWHPLPGGNSRRFASSLALGRLWLVQHAKIVATSAPSDTDNTALGRLLFSSRTWRYKVSTREPRPARLIAALACVVCPLTRPVDLPPSRSSSSGLAVLYGAASAATDPVQAYQTPTKCASHSLAAASAGATAMSRLSRTSYGTQQQDTALAATIAYDQRYIYNPNSTVYTDLLRLLNLPMFDIPSPDEAIRVPCYGCEIHIDHGLLVHDPSIEHDAELDNASRLSHAHELLNRPPVRRPRSHQTTATCI